MIHSAEVMASYKKFTVDKELMKMDFYLQFIRYLRGVRLPELGCSLLDIYSHIDSDMIAQLHPAVQKAIEYSEDTIKCLAAGEPVPLPPFGVLVLVALLSSSSSTSI